MDDSSVGEQGLNDLFRDIIHMLSRCISSVCTCRADVGGRCNQLSSLLLVALRWEPLRVEACWNTKQMNHQVLSEVDAWL